MISTIINEYNEPKTEKQLAAEKSVILPKKERSAAGYYTVGLKKDGTVVSTRHLIR